eukprot:4560638-Lingulodinium_polyedra.AAC.1
MVSSTYLPEQGFVLIEEDSAGAQTRRHLLAEESVPFEGQAWEFHVDEGGAAFIANDIKATWTSSLFKFKPELVDGALI